MRLNSRRLIAFSLAALLAACGIPPQISKVSTVRSFLTLDEIAKAFGVQTATYKRPDYGDAGRPSATTFCLSTVEIDPTPAGQVVHADFEMHLNFCQDAVRTKAAFNDLRESIGLHRPLEYPSGLGDDAYYWESQAPPITGDIDRALGVLIGDRYLTISSHSSPQSAGGPVLSKDAFLALAHLAVERARAAKLPTPNHD